MNRRISEYRSMWVFVFFDLPTETKKQRKAASKFRKDLLNDGFIMFQFSFYIRHCPSRENADVHRKRVRRYIPDVGIVGMLCVTDKQFSMMELFQGKVETNLPVSSQQLELF